VDPQGESVYTEPQKVTKRKIAGIRIKCPSCGATYVYKDENKESENRVLCQNCGESIEASGEDVFIVEETTGGENAPCDVVAIVLVLVLFLFVPWILSIPIIICIFVARSRGSFTTRVEKRQGIDIG
jgi:predicted RNA-binding Zn-ribbon protein involved in translation (DUF1610 family)